MRRVFYGNITYVCNNDCRRCISKSVKKGRTSLLTLDDYRHVDDLYHVTETDVWNINGGEPTMSPFFHDIVDFCHKKSRHIVVYSNGRNLGRLPLGTIGKIERIIVPLYGAESEHDDYVNCVGAFYQTIESISTLVSHNKNLLEIKLLLNESSTIKDLQESEAWAVLIQNVHFSVTRVLSSYSDNSICSEDISRAGEILIQQLVNEGKKVRFYDIPFCSFSTAFRRQIKSSIHQVDYFSPYAIHILPDTTDALIF